MDHDATDLSSIDIADPGVYERGIPHDAFARLRRLDPVHWHPWDNSRGGFWAVTTKDDLTTVTRDWNTFTSEEHVNLWELDAEAQAARRSLIETDGMPHTRLRRLVTQPFTLRRMAEYTDATRAIVDELLDAMIGAGPVDVVRMLSEPLPIRVIVSILGIPRSDGDFLVHLSNQLVEGTSDREQDPHAYGNTTPLELLPFNSPAAHALFEFGRTLGAERRANPGDDLVSKLITAEVDGDHLTDAEFCNFFQLLVFAGNETTRTAISNGLIAFMQHPEQLQRLQDDPSLIPNAVEEVIRWATPVLHMRRTATADTELHGTRIAAGDWVVIWYASANFDEAAFERPLEFDVARPVKPEHVAFGAFGPHHCLGAPLARLEIRLLLEQLVARRIRIEAAGIPARVRSNFVNGVLSLPAVVAAG
ncbi:MAG: cytochrome P450 [Acidimicrobiales bacterium]|nr:cytochrome P450 [Acidimicrobiales bacterium]MCB9392376.1 cytochrome P450 [Acidimicrobiaceae bacterium]